MTIEPDLWATTHPSYRALRPRRNFNALSPDDELEDDYALRMEREHGIPPAVSKQWLYGLYENERSVTNYAWIDFSAITFERETWTTQRLTRLRVIEAYRSSFVMERAAAFNSIEEFVCLSGDKQHWLEHGTWRVPPIALDVTSLGPPPAVSDIDGPEQLVEGHSRLGYLLACCEQGLPHAAQHDVFVMRLSGG